VASIALVLNLQTGRVSPQFHVQFDPTFQTMKASFGGQSPKFRWQSIWGFTSDLAMKQEGATNGVPNWAPEPVAVEVPSNLPDLQSADSDVDDDSKSVSMIGCLEDEGFQTSENQTLWRSNRVRKPVERFEFEAMLAEILDTTTNAEEAEFEDTHSPAPGGFFAWRQSLEMKQSLQITLCLHFVHPMILTHFAFMKHSVHPILTSSGMQW
jgi:hypothetical protein